jgi:hypothetical protein
MIRGYLNGYFKSTDVHPAIPEWHVATNAVLQIALMFTDSDIA